MEELKACPFCGKKDTVDFTTCVETEDCAHFEECPEEEPYYCVVCNIHKGGCGASGGFAPTRQEAVEKWDRRAAPENKPLTLEELRKMQGQPVYCIGQTRFDVHFDGWKVVTKNNSMVNVIRFTDGTDFPVDVYGKRLLAYARRPEDATEGT